MEECEVGRASDLKAAGAELLPDGRRGLRLKGWQIESFSRPILTSLAIQEYAFSNPSPPPLTAYRKVGSCCVISQIFVTIEKAWCEITVGKRLTLEALDELNLEREKT